MARCFCGCGQRVSFGGRQANLYGGNALRLLVAVDDAILGLAKDDWRRVAFLDEGQSWMASWASVVHGERSVRSIDYAGWTDWRKRAVRLSRDASALASETRKACAAAGITPESWVTVFAPDGFDEAFARAGWSRLSELRDDTA
jgi:hypothetical protein